MNGLKYTEKIYRDEFGDYYIIIPYDILEELGWNVSDKLTVEPCEVLDYDGETKGLVISKSKEE